MKDQSKNIDTLLLEELGNITELPPPSVWVSLEARLDERRRRHWWFWPLALIVLISGTVIGYRNWPAQKNAAPAVSLPGMHQSAATDDNNNNAPLPGTINVTIANDTGKQQEKVNTPAPGENSTNSGPGQTQDIGETRDQAEKKHKSGYTPGTKSKAQPADDTTGTITANSEEEHASAAQQTGTANARNNDKTALAVKASIAATDKPHNTSGTKQKMQAVAGTTNTTTANTTQDHIPGTQQNGTANNRNNNKTGAALAAKATIAATDKPGNTSTAKLKAQPVAGTTNTTQDHTPGTQQNGTVNNRNNNKTEAALAAKATITATDKPGNTPAAKLKAQPADSTTNTTANRGQEHAPGTPQKGTAKDPDNNNKTALAGKTPVTDKPEHKGMQPGLKDPQATTATKATSHIKDQEEATSSKLLPPPTEAGAKTPPSKRSSDTPPATLKKAAVPEESDPPALAAKATKPASKIRVTDENGKAVLPAAGTEPNKTATKDPGPKDDYLKQQKSGDADGGGEAMPKAANKEKRNTPGRFEAGVKLGYETGAETYTARKLAFAAYLQYNITPRLGLVFQPAIKSAQTNQDNARTTGTYYQVTSMRDSLYQMRDSFYSFAYRQTFDSFVARTTTERKYIELDLPVMLKYQLDKHIALSAGLNLSLGKIINLNSELQTYKGLELRDTSVAVLPIAPPPAPKFSHPGSVPFSSYVPPDNTTDAPLRVGYTLGVTYTFRERFMVDFMMQKTTSNLDKIPDSEIRKIYSQHYFKMMFGYKLFAPKKKVREIP